MPSSKVAPVADPLVPTRPSFRDPLGHLLILEDRVIRVVKGRAAPELKKFLAGRVARDFTAAGRLVETRILDTNARAALQRQVDLHELLTTGDLLVEHERVHFPTFPYEWPPEMLHAAGTLTLDLAESALAENYLLKDATPYNVLFLGWHPIFVDVLSFEQRDPHSLTWLAFNQFVQTFLLPLLVNKQYGLRLDQLLTINRDGLEPAEVARLPGRVRKLSPDFLSLVSVPHWLNKKQPLGEESLYQPKKVGNPDRARFVLQQQLKRLRRQLRKVEPQNRTSAWSDYMAPDKFFSLQYLAAKENFVARVLRDHKPRTVLDVGCNTGHFSLLAARLGANVTAIDQDPGVVGNLWKQASSEHLKILPIVVNLARPTPAIGWRNEECPSFLDRARGKFNLVLMLAVLHHLMVTEQIPLPAILELAAELTSQSLVIEFVAPADQMFRHLVRGRDELFASLSQESFALTAARWFEIKQTEHLTPTRSIYLLRKRDLH